MTATIALGYDGSACARRALARTATLAQLIPGATVLVVQAFEFSIGYVPTGMTSSPLMMSAEFDAHMERVRGHAEQQAAEAAARLTATGVDAETLVVEGKPVEVLLAAARAREAILIAVGSHGEGAVSAAFMGSTALKLLNHSEIPVLVVPRRRQD